MPRMKRYNGGGRDPMNAQPYRTQRADLPEDLWQPLYDRAHYAAAGTSDLSFFSVPKGQTATLIEGQSINTTRTKSYRDTNNENANVVPTKMFKIVGISIGFIHQDPDNVANSQDRTLVRDNGYINFRIVDKDIIFLPLLSLPESNPIIATSTTATSSTINSSAGGGGHSVPMYKFPIPITINPYENFSVSMKWDTTVAISNAMDVNITLHAFMRRPT